MAGFGLSEFGIVDKGIVNWKSRSGPVLRVRARAAVGVGMRLGIQIRVRVRREVFTTWVRVRINC